VEFRDESVNGLDASTRLRADGQTWSAHKGGYTLVTLPRTVTPYTLVTLPRTVTPYTLVTLPRTLTPYTLVTLPRTVTPYTLVTLPRTVTPYRDNVDRCRW
jgi:hypothetical protein